MPSRADIVTFQDAPAPPGASPWLPGKGPQVGVRLVEPDPRWSTWYAELASTVRTALGWRVLGLEHVGSTSVTGLVAKPIIDVDLVVADPDDEPRYVPALEAVGLELRVREPWWYGHRMLRSSQPPGNLHVFGCDSPEPIRNRLFRDWLRGNPDEVARYARVKREAADVANAAGEHVMQYNARKQRVIREIYQRAFVAAGLLEE